MAKEPIQHAPKQPPMQAYQPDKKETARHSPPLKHRAKPKTGQLSSLGKLSKTPDRTEGPSVARRKQELTRQVEERLEAFGKKSGHPSTAQYYRDNLKHMIKGAETADHMSKLEAVLGDALDKLDEGDDGPLRKYATGLKGGVRPQEAADILNRKIQSHTPDHQNPRYEASVNVDTGDIDIRSTQSGRLVASVPPQDLVGNTENALEDLLQNDPYLHNYVRRDRELSLDPSHAADYGLRVSDGIMADLGDGIGLRTQLEKNFGVGTKSIAGELGQKLGRETKTPLAFILDDVARLRSKEQSSIVEEGVSFYDANADKHGLPKGFHDVKPTAKEVHKQIAEGAENLWKSGVLDTVLTEENKDALKARLLDETAANWNRYPPGAMRFRALLNKNIQEFVSGNAGDRADVSDADIQGLSRTQAYNLIGRLTRSEHDENTGLSDDQLRGLTDRQRDMLSKRLAKRLEGNSARRRQARADLLAKDATDKMVRELAYALDAPSKKVAEKIDRAAIQEEVSQRLIDVQVGPEENPQTEIDAYYAPGQPKKHKFAYDGDGHLHALVKLRGGAEKQYALSGVMPNLDGADKHALRHRDESPVSLTQATEIRLNNGRTLDRPDLFQRMVYDEPTSFKGKRWNHRSSDLEGAQKTIFEHEGRLFELNVDQRTGTMRQGREIMPVSGRLFPVERMEGRDGNDRIFILDNKGNKRFEVVDADLGTQKIAIAEGSRANGGRNKDLLSGQKEVYAVDPVRNRILSKVVRDETPDGKALYWQMPTPRGFNANLEKKNKLAGRLNEQIAVTHRDGENVRTENVRVRFYPGTASRPSSVEKKLLEHRMEALEDALHDELLKWADLPDDATEQQVRSAVKDLLDREFSTPEPSPFKRKIDSILQTDISYHRSYLDRKVDKGSLAGSKIPPYGSYQKGGYQVANSNIYELSANMVGQTPEDCKKLLDRHVDGLIAGKEAIAEKRELNAQSADMFSKHMERKKYETSQHFKAALRHSIKMFLPNAITRLPYVAMSTGAKAIVP